MVFAPIVLFTYNRPEETRKTLQSILTNAECEKSVLYIFSDAPKKETDREKVEQVRKILHELPRNRFADIEIIEQTENRGLAKSIISGVQYVFEAHDRIIVLEDDCEVSPYFLNYMNGALEQYENDDSIGSISGYSPELKTKLDTDVYAVLRSCSWSWSCWKKVWDRVDFSVQDYPALRYNKAFIRDMNRAGNDRMYRLIRQVKYNLQSWSVRFGADLTKRGLLTVYPKYSYVKNIGLESGGVHSSKKAPKALKVTNKLAIPQPVFPSKLTENSEIEGEFRRIYGGNAVSRLKRDLYVFGGERIIDYVKRKK